jgi:hypothetical protein
MNVVASPFADCALGAAIGMRRAATAMTIIITITTRSRGGCG